VVRVVKGRVVPVKSAAKALADPLALADRAFVGLFKIGEAVCPGGYADSMVRWRFDEAVFAICMSLYTAQEALPTESLRELIFEVVNRTMIGDFAISDEAISRQLIDNDVDRLTEQLSALGVVDKAGGQVGLTGLGTALIANYLGGLDVDVPTVDSFADETAEVVVVAATTAPARVRDELLSRWCEHNKESAAVRLRSLAERTDDRTHRRFVTSFLRRR
jgi:hypothetical protein